MREELRSNQCARSRSASSSTYKGRTETTEKARTADNRKICPVKCRRNQNQRTRAIWNWAKRNTKPTDPRAERTRASRTDDGRRKEQGTSEATRTKTSTNIQNRNTNRTNQHKTTTRNGIVRNTATTGNSTVQRTKSNSK